MDKIYKRDDDFNWVDLGIRRNGMKILFADRNVGAEQPHDLGTHSKFDEAMQITFDSKEVQIPEEEDLDLLIVMNDVEFIHNYNDTGKNGLLITGRNEFAKNSIFLPAAGYCRGSSLFDTGDCGSYWSRSLNVSNPHYAWFLFFNCLFLYFNCFRDDVNSWTEDSGHYYGYSVRPVLVTGAKDNT